MKLNTATSLWRRLGRTDPVSSLGRVGMAALFVVLIGALAGGNGFWILILSTAAISYIVVGSYNLIFGYAGLFSLAHVALFGIGAYVSLYLEARFDTPFWWGALAAVLITLVCGLILSVPTARLGGAFLAVATLAFSVLIYDIMSNWTEVTGGHQGLFGPKPAAPFGTDLLAGTLGFYWFVAGCAVVCFEAFFRLSRSVICRQFIALKESEAATQSVGINPARVRTLAYLFSSAFVGFAGVLQAHVTMFVTPDSFALHLTIQILIATALGGGGRVLGPLLGVAALVGINQSADELGSLSPLLFGLAIIVVIGLAPDGLVGVGARTFRRLRPQPPERVVPKVEVRADSAAPTRIFSDRLVVEDVSLQYQGVGALDAVSLQIEPGEVLGLIGPNGAGKTSLVNVITGRVVPTRGSARLGSTELVGKAPYEVARVGVVRTFQHSQLVPSLDLITNVTLGHHAHGRASLIEQSLMTSRGRDDDESAKSLALELMTLVGVEKFAGTRVADLPYGVLRRAEIARALAAYPAFLLLDEPGAGLGAHERAEVASAIKAVAGMGVGCMLIDHNVSFVADVAQRLVVLASGRVMTEGPSEEVLQHPEVISVYLGKSGAL